MKICSGCGYSKNSIDFHKCNKSNDGYKNSCKVCRNFKNKLHNARPEIKEKNKLYQENRRNQSTYSKYREEIYKKHKNKIRLQHKKYDSHPDNKVRKIANGAKYRATKLSATPKWLTEDHFKEIKEIYRICPKGFHVDHIVPLRGVMVCGLHVPWNLQVITAEENLSKGNKNNG